MLASFFIIYIVVRTQLRPEDAPLPPPVEGEPAGAEKAILFLLMLLGFAGGIAAVLLLRAGVIQGMGQAIRPEGEAPLALVDPASMWVLAGIVVVAVVAMLLAGRERTKLCWRMSRGLIAPIVVIGAVLGSIYGGITGITEAAGMGVVAVLVIAALRGEMSLELITDSLLRTVKSTGTIIWITIGATALAGAYTIAGGPTYVANLIIGAELPTMGIILIMMLIFLILGMFMDWVGIVLLVMPVFLPIVSRLPVEEIGLFGVLPASFVAVWFGVVFCMNMQVSFLSPPFGPAAFYLKSVAPPEISLTDIFRGFMPFIFIQLLALSILLLWPGLTYVLHAE